MTFNQKAFNKFTINYNVLGFFETEVTLSSGRKSYWYANWRNIANDPFLLEQLTEYILEFTHDKGLKPDCFYGVPEGATKLGNNVQKDWAKRSPKYGPGSHILPMGRANPKRHGLVKDKDYIGAPEGKTIFLEDVTTTGSSLIKACLKSFELQQTDNNYKILAAIGLTDREETTDGSVQNVREGLSVAEALAQFDIPYYSLSRASELLPLAYEKINPGVLVIKSIEKEFQKYGV